MRGRPSFLRSMCRVLAIGLAAGGVASAQSVVFSANFETGIPAAFSAGGALTTLTTTSLPTDGAGISSPNQSSWLGALGQGIGKNTASGEIVTLSLTGLTAGAQYSVAFDLLIGASWDGAAGTYGPDEWRLRADGAVLVDTIFSDSNGAGNMGAYSPQRYSDTTFTDPNGPDQAYFAGADFHYVSGTTDYSGDYSIYYFGHGTGNPFLSFTASGTTAALEFARLPTASGDSGDEYWALDNVNVTAIPEPTETGLWLAGLATIACASRRRRSAD